MAEDLKLKVNEAIQDDVNKGIVRVDSGYMKELGVKPGDIVQIEGERQTVAVIDRAYPGDLGMNIIRMDGITRRNAKTGIGEYVKIVKAEFSEAKKITIAPSHKGIVVRASPKLFQHGLLGRAVQKGDIVSLGGTRRRKNTMSQSPFFEDIFNILEDTQSGFGFGDLKFTVVDSTPKGAVIITEQTEIVYNPEAVDVTEEAVLEVTYEDIGGLDEELTKIREMVELPLKHPELFQRLGIEAPKGVLLHGTPGTGKTLLAKAVANETNSHFIVINGPEIMSKYYGQSEENLRKKFEEAEKNAPAIIFIDELDSVAPKREESKGEVERRVVAQLLALMDGLKSRGKVIVIAATNIVNSLDPALRRPGRFDREIEIGVPNVFGREKILKIHTRNMPLGDNVKLSEIAGITHGFVGADLNSLSKEAAMTVVRRLLPHLTEFQDKEIPKEFLEKMIITKEDFMEALKVVRPSAMREVLVEVPTISWEDVGGMQDIKDELKEAVELPLKSPEKLSKLGIRSPKGIMMYGPPGTGKTLLAKAIANESESNFILVKGPELLSKWVGESEKAVRKIFQKARETAPTIIFFDEIDSMTPKRSASEDNKVTERVVNQLLSEIDGVEEMRDVVIIAATNRPDIVDPALLRPGRFDRIILVSGPDVDTRENILKVHTKGMPLKDVDLRQLAEKMEGYAGADIEAVAREAGIMALRKNTDAAEVTMADFEDALSKVKPSITPEIDKAYRDIREHFSAASGKQVKDQLPSYFG